MKLIQLKAFICAVLVCTVFGHSAFGDIDSFGTGVNQFGMEFLPIGDANNLDDIVGVPNPAGRVEYLYRMAKFEVSEDMVNKFNASQGLTVTHDNRGANMPATSISWNEAARFVNWLNTSQGYQAAYNFPTSGVNDNITAWSASDAWQLGGQNVFRHKDAHYWLPSMDEWYKAAYYNPATTTYLSFAAGSNAAPTAISSGTGANSNVYDGQLGPSDITSAGGLSPYGIMALGGNVYEWEETEIDLLNDDGSALRGARGGFWESNSYLVSSLNRVSNDPTDPGFCLGIRVASIYVVPEPNSLTLSVACLAGLLSRSRRNRK